jgi:hypothetical protein
VREAMQSSSRGLRQSDDGQLTQYYLVISILLNGQNLVALTNNRTLAPAVERQEVLSWRIEGDLQLTGIEMSFEVIGAVRKSAPGTYEHWQLLNWNAANSAWTKFVKTPPPGAHSGELHAALVSSQPQVKDFFIILLSSIAQSIFAEGEKRCPHSHQHCITVSPTTNVAFYFHHKFTPIN